MAYTPNRETAFLKEYLEELSQPTWIVGQSNLGGRGLYATQTIKKGSVIFTNKPIIVAPRADSVRETFCSICYKISGSCTACDICSSLICGEDCKSSTQHQLECNYITNNWKAKLHCGKYSEILKSALMYVRFLNLTEQHKSLLSILQPCSTKPYVKEIENLCLAYTIPEDQVQFIELAESIMKVNSFRIAHNFQTMKVSLRGLYPLSAFLNHSCIPNTRNVFGADYTMSVYATKDILTGEEILTCYTGLLWCTPARRCQLYKTKDFWCKCARCEDRTEMGTNLSALKCFNKDCVGILLPKSPVNFNVEWFCDNCSSNIPASKVCTVQSVLGSLVGSLDLDNQFRIEAPLLARLANLIPYSNHIFVEIRLRLAQRIGFTGLKLNELSEARLALKEKLSRGTLRTLAALGAGDAHLRGLLLYHLHAALAERARRSPDLYEELKAEIESTIEQAYYILRGDISAPPDLELRRRYLGPGCDKPQEERFFILDV